MASPPFEYEDLLSKSIKVLEDRNNRTDPTGKLNELRLPPKRRQQAAALPKFDNAEQQYVLKLTLTRTLLNKLIKFELPIHHGDTRSSFDSLPERGLPHKSYFTTPS